MRSPPKSLIDHMCVIVEEVGSEPFTSRDLSTPGTRRRMLSPGRSGATSRGCDVPSMQRCSGATSCARVTSASRSRSKLFCGSRRTFRVARYATGSSIIPGWHGTTGRRCEHET